MNKKGFTLVEILAVLYSKCMTHFNDWKKNPEFSGAFPRG